MYNRFLNTFGYQIHSEDWNLSFQSHPNYPDITAISETLDVFNVENIIAEVPRDLLDDLPDTFIALIVYNSKPENVLITKEVSQEIRMIFTDNTQKKMTKDQFLELWTGVLLSIDYNPRSGEQKKNTFRISKNNAKYVLGAISLLLFISLNYSIKNFSAISSIYCFVSLFGLALSFLSIKESLGFHSNLTSRICSANNSDCDKIFFSRGAEIINGVTMSDLGFIYFLFSSVAAFSLFLSGASILLLSISIITLPVVVYSVYYQYFKAKTWCVICLGIALAAILQIIILSFASYSSVKTTTFLLLISLLSGIATIWLFLKPSFDQLGTLGFLEVDYSTITRRYDIFNSIFSNSQNVQGLNEIDRIKLDRNSEAEINVTVILSPTCGACERTYLEIKKMQTYYSEEIHFSLVFNIKTNIDDKIRAVFIRLLEMAMKEETENLIQGLDDWFINKFSESKWLKKWKRSQLDYSDLIERYNIFLGDNELYNTPTILINNIVYPMPYKLSELKYFIKEMESQCNESL